MALLASFSDKLLTQAEVLPLFHFPSAKHLLSCHLKFLIQLVELEPNLQHDLGQCSSLGIDNIP